MSDFGIGEIIGAILVAAGYTVAYAAMGVAMLARGVFRLTAKAAKAAYEAYVAHEERRRREAEAELGAVGGILGENAVALHHQLASLEKEASESAEHLLDSMVAAGEDMAAAAARVEEDATHSMTSLHTELTAGVKQLNERFADEQTRFRAALQTKTIEMSTAFGRQINAQYENAKEQLDAAIADMAARNAAYLKMAKEKLTDAEAMLAALTRLYDCETYAPERLTAVRTNIAELERLIGANLGADACGAAATCENELQHLQLQAELNTAQAQRERMLIDQAAESLRAVLDASGTLMDDEVRGTDLERWLDERAGFNMDFWSQGRMTRLQNRAGELLERCAAHRFSGSADGTVGTDVATLIYEAQELRQEMIQEMGRARAFVASRTACMDLARKTITAYREQGWEQANAPAFLGGDARKDLMLRFRKGDDVREVLIHCFYDEASSEYKIQIVRHSDEVGIPDQQRRRALDTALNEQATNAGIPANANPTCAQSTIGGGVTWDDILGDGEIRF